MTGFPVSFPRYAGFLLASLPQLAALPPLKGGRHRVLDAALDAVAGRPGVGLEFGVWKGSSLRHAARRQPRRAFHGFDSLRGFPEDGRRDWRMDFSLAAAPRLPLNCTFHTGWFEESVPPFATRLDAPVALVNLDCDIYSSAWTVLAALAPHLRPGVAIHLDEALNYDTWLWNEMLALFQLTEATGLGVTWIGCGGRVRGLPETLAMLEAGRYPVWRDDVEAGYARQAACVLTAGGALASPPEAQAFAERLEARHAAHLAGTQIRRDCHPDDRDAPPPPARPAWRRLLGL